MIYYEKLVFSSQSIQLGLAKPAAGQRCGKLYNVRGLSVQGVRAIASKLSLPGTQASFAECILGCRPFRGQRKKLKTKQAEGRQQAASSSVSPSQRLKFPVKTILATEPKKG